MGAEMTRESRPGLRSAATYAGAVVATALLLCWLYGLTTRDLRVPISYEGDGLISFLYSKLIVDRGWPLNHPAMGAPHGLAMHDFQFASNLQFGMLWILSLGTSDPFFLVNLYYLASYPLTALACLAVLRHLGVGRLPALVAALLYAFLPFHHLRGIPHLFLSNYFVVPLAALLTLWAWGDEPLFGGKSSATGWRRWIGLRGVATLLLAVVVGSTAVYYAFFTCLLLATAAIARWCRHHRLSAGVGPMVVAAVIGLTVIVNLAPLWSFTLQNGPNPDAVRRGRWAQRYDLRISQALAPTSDHRIPLVARAKAIYNSHLPLLTENDTASLGFVGAIGFLFLLGRLLYSPRSAEPSSPLDAATRANAATLLFATMGGFGSLLTIGFPQIRCYNRMSVFLSFFALFAAAHLLDRLLSRWGTRAAGRLAGAALCLALVTVGVWEETPASTSQPDPAVEAQFSSDKEFVRRVESEIPTGGMVLQLPYIAFPEGRGYDHLRLSLHSRTSRWSFGSMRGRYADLWQRQTCGLDCPDLLRQVCEAGFAGIACDRVVMTPDEAVRERRLADILGTHVLTSADGRFVFYALADHAARLGIGSDPGADERGRILSLHPVLLGWGKGFEPPEDIDIKPSLARWGDARAELTLFNALDYERSVVLSLSLRSNPGTTGTLRILGQGLDLSERLSPEPRDIQLALTVPPGQCTVAFECDAPSYPGRRHWLFEVVSWRLQPSPPSPEVAHGR
jgi:hypothetical protein